MSVVERRCTAARKDVLARVCSRMRGAACACGAVHARRYPAAWHTHADTAAVRFGSRGRGGKGARRASPAAADTRGRPASPVPLGAWAPWAARATQGT